MIRRETKHSLFTDTNSFRKITNFEEWYPTREEATARSEKFRQAEAEKRLKQSMRAAAPCIVDAGQSLLASLDPDTLNPEQFNAWCRLDEAIAKAKGGAA